VHERVAAGPSGRAGTSVCISGPKFFGAASCAPSDALEEPRENRNEVSRQADHGHAPRQPVVGAALSGGATSGTLGGDPPRGVTSGTLGGGPAMGGAPVVPCMAASRQRKAVRFAEHPAVLLVTDSGSDEYTFDNKDAGGTPKVSQTSIRRRKVRNRPGCPITAEIVAHAMATDLLMGVEPTSWPEPHCLLHRGRRPSFPKASLFGVTGEMDYTGSDLEARNAY